MLEGMRNGQPLAALLGYRFERGLHDAHGLAEVDKFIYPLRQVFPLVANQLESTQDRRADITLLEARNVLDGLKLLDADPDAPQTRPIPSVCRSAAASASCRRRPQPSRPPSTPKPTRWPTSYDAIADLVLAESVYQVVLGNFDRAAANTNAFSKGSRPPETQVVDTPRTRFVAHPPCGAAPRPARRSRRVSPSAVADDAARAGGGAAQPLARGPHAGSRRRCRPGHLHDAALAAPKTVTLSQGDLGLQPLDLLYLVNLELEQAMSELDDRIVQAVRYGADAPSRTSRSRSSTPKPVAGKVTLFELAALVRSLRALVLESRALGPADMAMPLEAKAGEAVWDDGELAIRVNAAIASLHDPPRRRSSRSRPTPPTSTFTRTRSPRRSWRRRSTASRSSAWGRSTATSAPSTTRSRQGPGVRRRGGTGSSRVRRAPRSVAGG